MGEEEEEEEQTETEVDLANDIGVEVGAEAEKDLIERESVAQDQGLLPILDTSKAMVTAAEIVKGSLKEEEEEEGEGIIIITILT